MNRLTDVIRKFVRSSAVLIVLAVQMATCEAHDVEQLEADIRQSGPGRFSGLDLQQVVSAFGLLGIEHILSGFDHLMFVVALTLMFGFGRKLVWAVTGFTVAHSVTLALATLGLLRLPSAPIEAWIALSIVVVSAEALSRRRSMTYRFPFIVPMMIGLIHGLGFAGALSEIGLPDAYRAAAILSFNLGVEAGQLGVIGILGLIARVGMRPSWNIRVRVITLCVFGSVAAYWTIARVWELVTF